MDAQSPELPSFLRRSAPPPSEDPSEEPPSLLGAFLMLGGGGWIAIEAPITLIEFVQTHSFVWPKFLMRGPGGFDHYVVLTYASYPILTVVILVVTAISGILGLAAVILGLSGLLKRLGRD